MPTSLEQYTNNRYQGASYQLDERTAAGMFGASLTLAAGTAIAKKTSDGKLYAYSEPNDVQTVTLTSATAGTFRIGFTDKNGATQWTTTIAYNAVQATIQTACDTVLGAGEVAIAGGAASFTITFSGTDYKNAKQDLVKLDLGALTATNCSVAHSATYDGTDTCVGITIFDIMTDASGNVFYSTSSTTASTLNHPRTTGEYLIAGTFDPSTLTGFDAGALKDLGGHVGADGYYHIPH